MFVDVWQQQAETGLQVVMMMSLLAPFHWRRILVAEWGRSPANQILEHSDFLFEVR